MRDEAVVAAGYAWDDLFMIDDRVFSRFHNIVESELVQALATGRVADTNLVNYARSTEGPSWNPHANLLNTRYGDESVLVGFSTATALGSMVITIVPEPATWAVVATAAGVICAVSRRG